jgi:hypothetical protein
MSAAIDAIDIGALQLPPPTCDVAQAKADLARYGLAIVEDALSADELQALRTRIVEQAAGERQAGVASMEHGQANQRIWNLINKGDVFAELLHKPLVRDFMSHILQGRFTISSYTANIAGKGGEEMVLHADQGYAPIEIDIPLHGGEWRHARGAGLAPRARIPAHATGHAVRRRHGPCRQRADLRRPAVARHRPQRHGCTAARAAHLLRAAVHAPAGELHAVGGTGGAGDGVAVAEGTAGLSRVALAGWRGGPVRAW